MAIDLWNGNKTVSFELFDQIAVPNTNAKLNYGISTFHVGFPLASDSDPYVYRNLSKRNSISILDVEGRANLPFYGDANGNVISICLWPENMVLRAEIRMQNGIL